MKLTRRLTSIAGLIAFSLSTAASTSGDDIPLTIFVTTVAQSDSPVQIVGLKMPDKIDTPPTVLFRNVSGKEVRRLTLVGQIGNPSDPEINRGPVYRNPYTSGPDADTLALVLPSGDSGENVNQLPPTSALVALAMQLRSNCVHMAVVVELVEFSDGTQWVNQERSLWQKSLTADSAKRCDNSPRVQEAMRQLQGGSFTVVREPSHPDQKMQPSYSYSCSMHKDENYKFAHCPF